MISLGFHITAPDDPLQKVDLEKVWHAIQSPQPDTAARIRQLRIVRNLNPKQYSSLKRDLPYLVCGMFNPPRRRVENFAYTEYFILDLDHLSAKGVCLAQLRAEIQKDPRVVLCFASPSEDGLKVMFRLNERCYDAGVFSLFYKLFAQKFSQQYAVQQVIDMKTCDVSRACFVSMDAEAYYNPDPEPVDLKSYVDTESQYDFFSCANNLECEAKEQKQAAASVEAPQPKGDVGDDVMANIRAILNPAARQACAKPPAYVPQQLEDVMEELRAYITQTGVEITEVISIQYGKKIRSRVGVKMAETNVFYGRKGYSVVISPRTGTNPELNNAVADLVKAYFNIL